MAEILQVGQLDDFFEFDYRSFSIVPIEEDFYREVVDKAIKNYSSVLRKIKLGDLKNDYNLINDIFFCGVDVDVVIHIDVIRDGKVFISFVFPNLFGPVGSIKNLFEQILLRRQIFNKISVGKTGHLSSVVYLD